MTTKDVIAQAEKEVAEKFKEKWGQFYYSDSVGIDWEKPQKQNVEGGVPIESDGFCIASGNIVFDFQSFLSSYTKDLLQSVESELDVLDTCLEGLPIDAMSIINTKFYANDVVKRLKEVKADIISKLR